MPYKKLILKAAFAAVALPLGVLSAMGIYHYGFAPFRPLTEGEIELARKYHGDKIDYSAVRIKSTDYAFILNPVVGHKVSAWGNTITYKTELYQDDFSRTDNKVDKETLLHELRHVYQAQSGTCMTCEGIKILLANKFKYQDGYQFELKPTSEVSDFNIEQQGRMMERLYVRENYSIKPEDCEEAAHIRKILDLPREPAVPCKILDFSNPDSSVFTIAMPK